MGEDMELFTVYFLMDMRQERVQQAASLGDYVVKVGHWTFKGSY